MFVADLFQVAHFGSLDGGAIRNNCYREKVIGLSCGSKSSVAITNTSIRQTCIPNKNELLDFGCLFIALVILHEDLCYDDAEPAKMSNTQNHDPNPPYAFSPNTPQCL